MHDLLPHSHHSQGITHNSISSYALMYPNLVFIAVSIRIVLLLWSISLIALNKLKLDIWVTTLNKSLLVSYFLCQDNPFLALSIPSQFKCCVNNSCLLMLLYVLSKPVFKMITIIKHSQVFYYNQICLIQNKYFKISNTSFFKKKIFQRF